MFDECFQDVFLYCRSKAEGGMEIPSRTPQAGSSSSETPPVLKCTRRREEVGEAGWCQVGEDGRRDGGSVKAQGERGEVQEGLRGDPPLMGALDIILFHAGDKPSEIRIMLQRD